jgi:hypothetical protein
MSERWTLKIGDMHPEYGRVSTMVVLSGERYLWFDAGGGVVVLVPATTFREADDE